MAENKKTFILYTDLTDVLEILDDEKAGQLFKTILRYVNDKDPHPKDPIVNIAWLGVKSKLKRDLKNYEAKRQGSKKGANITNLKKYRPKLYKKYKDGEISYNEVLDIIDTDNGIKKPVKKNNKPVAASQDKKPEIKTNEVIDSWNLFFEGSNIPKVKSMTPTRLKSFSRIIKKYGDRVIYDTLKKAKQSKFINDSTFFTFDWFYNETNFIKVMEGNYDNKADLKPNLENRANQILNS